MSRKKSTQLHHADFVTAKYQTDLVYFRDTKNGKTQRDGDFPRRDAHVCEQKIRTVDKFKSGGDFSQRERTGNAFADARGAEFNERDGTREQRCA